MKTKALILIGAVWILSLFLFNTPVIYSSPIAYVTLIIAFSIAIFLLLRHANQQIQNLIQDNQHLKNQLAENKAAKKTLSSQEKVYEQLAHYDNLTELPNRILFSESLNKSIAHAKRHNKYLAVLVVNIDSFSHINTTYGHDVGDQVLKEIGVHILKALRSEDILAKLDGDEFVVLLSDLVKPKYASAVAEKILEACSSPINIQSHEITLKASVGVCVYPNDGDSLEMLFKNLYTALQAVKRAGGGGYQFYTKEMDTEARSYIQLADALHHAIENNELCLHYQPRIHIKRGNITGVEALVRWSHPELGIINPSVFIPLAEETNLILPIGEWALYEACKINKYWQDEGYDHIAIGVNLSPKQFYHPDIANVISKVLKDTGLNPYYLELEINESTVMDNIELATEILNKIKATGVQIIIDHFGIGSTSISHLKQFPINAIKIDKSFIKGLPYSPNDVAIVNAFIALAHNFGLEIVAEGVETAEQVQHLLTQNCDMVQGYYFNHPLSAQQIILQLKKIVDEVMT